MSLINPDTFCKICPDSVCAATDLVILQVHFGKITNENLKQFIARSINSVGLFSYINTAIKRARHMFYKFYLYIIELSHGLHIQPISHFTP